MQRVERIWGVTETLVDTSFHCYNLQLSDKAFFPVYVFNMRAEYTPCRQLLLTVTSEKRIHAYNGNKVKNRALILRFLMHVNLASASGTNMEHGQSSYNGPEHGQLY